MAVLIAGYVGDFLFPLSERLDDLQQLSPWWWAIGTKPLGQGIDGSRAVWLTVVTTLLVVLGTWAFGRRDRLIRDIADGSAPGSWPIVEVMAPDAGRAAREEVPVPRVAPRDRSAPLGLLLPALVPAIRVARTTWVRVRASGPVLRLLRGRPVRDLRPLLTRRMIRVGAVLLVTALGGGVGALLAPSTTARVGPLTTEVEVVPALAQDPGVQVCSRRWRVGFSTHEAPVDADARRSVDRYRPST